MITTQEKGAIGEHIAAAALLANGYQVFFNVAFCGTTDLVAFKENRTIHIQVRSFFSKKQAKWSTAKNVVDLRSSANHIDNGRSFEGICQYFALVDCATAEVYLVPVEFRKTQVHKTQVEQFRIFP